MNSHQRNMQQKFEELQGILRAKKPDVVLSESAIRSFCIGFYLPLIGSLAHLKDQTAAYNNISCLIRVEHGNTFLVKGHSDYDAFAKVSNE